MFTIIMTSLNTIESDYNFDIAPVTVVDKFVKETDREDVSEVGDAKSTAATKPLPREAQAWLNEMADFDRF